MLFPVSARDVQVSYPERRMETTSNLQSLNPVWKLMLLFHILYSLNITAMAVVIHIQIFALQVPSFLVQVLKARHFLQPFTIHGDSGTTVACTIHHYFEFSKININNVKCLHQPSIFMKSNVIIHNLQITLFSSQKSQSCYAYLDRYLYACNSLWHNECILLVTRGVQILHLSHLQYKKKKKLVNPSD